jgi:hypothetical protein
VVHNNEATIPAHHVVSQLHTLLKGIQHISVSNQILDSSINFASLVSHSVRQHRTERRWRQFRESESVLQNLKSAIYHTLDLVKAKFSRSYRSSAIRIRQIEKALTHKHLEAWVKFRSSKFDFLLVLEADATWIDSQKSYLARTIGSLSQEHPLYLNIAGGLDDGALQVDKLITHRDFTQDQEVRSFRKPVTNTSCAYIMNRLLVDLLLEEASEPCNQTLKPLGIDWLTNALFMKISDKGENIICQHFYPPLLIHGSISGSFTSWHPDRT